MSSFSEGQTHQLVEALEAAGFTADDVTKLGQYRDLSDIRNVVRGHAEIVVSKRVVVRQPFNPAEFLGKGWDIWRGPVDGNGLEGDEDCDSRSLALQEIDFTRALFGHCLKEGETVITGEEKLRRLKESNHIRLDPGFAVALLNEPGRKTLEWYYQVTGKSYLDFFGKVLRGPRGFRSVLSLYRDDDGRWFRRCRWLVAGWHAGPLSAVLAD